MPDVPPEPARDLCRDVPRPLAALVGFAFGAGALVRGRRRALHPTGVTFRATVELVGRGTLLAPGGRGEALVRYSRGAGLPDRWRDVDGVALRLVDADGPGRHRDLLLSSCGPGPLRRVLVPNVDFGRGHFSSILRFAFDGEPVTLAASVEPSPRTMRELREGAPTTLTVRAVDAAGRAELLALVRTVEPVDGEVLGFDPLADDGVLVPLGLLNALRGPAYAASRRVRARGSSGGRGARAAPSADSGGR